MTACNLVASSALPGMFCEIEVRASGMGESCRSAFRRTALELTTASKGCQADLPQLLASKSCARYAKMTSSSVFSVSTSCPNGTAGACEIRWRELPVGRTCS